MRTLALITPDLFGSHGGISRITRSTYEAMLEFATSSGMRLEVHALHDAMSASQSSARVSYHPYAGSRARLAASVLRMLGSANVVATVYAHINLATLHTASQSPYFVTAHGIEVWSHLTRSRGRALRRAHRVLAVSHHTNRIVCGEHTIDPLRVRTIHNCLSSNWKTPVAKPANEVILVVTRLGETSEGKRVEDAILAFAHAKKELGLGAGWKLDIVGDGPMRATYERIALETGFGAEIRFFGRVSDDALEDHYARCAFFSLPSVNEGFGLVFLEAMSHGKAVLAASSGASPEVVRDGVTGILCAPGDIDELASAYARLARDEHLRATLGAQARIEVERRFGYAAYRDAIARELGALLADSPHGAVA